MFSSTPAHAAIRPRDGYRSPYFPPSRHVKVGRGTSHHSSTYPDHYYCPSFQPPYRLPGSRIPKPARVSRRSNVDPHARCHVSYWRPSSNPPWLYRSASQLLDSSQDDPTALDTLDSSTSQPWYIVPATSSPSSRSASRTSSHASSAQSRKTYDDEDEDEFDESFEELTIEYPAFMFWWALFMIPTILAIVLCIIGMVLVEVVSMLDRVCMEKLLSNGCGFG